MLNEARSLALLASAGVPVVGHLLCKTADEAAAAFAALGGPVAVKGCSGDVAHKSELGLVRLAPGADRAQVEQFRLFGVRLSGQFGVTLLIGSIDVEAGTPPRLRNTAFLVTHGGIAARYDKIHLVPFGEYVPLSGVIGFVRGWAEFIAELEPGTRAVVFAGPPAPFGIVICYEGIFPDLFREFVNNGARVMVNMTNDGWFGRTTTADRGVS